MSKKTKKNLSYLIRTLVMTFLKSNMIQFIPEINSETGFKDKNLIWEVMSGNTYKKWEVRQRRGRK